MRIDTKTLSGWRVATKTKGLRAKPLVNLLVDRTVLNKFLVDTLEGRESLGDGAVVCIGAEGDAWQQMPKKLLANYEVKAIDADGWMVCEPRPDNAVNCVEVTLSGDFTIIGQWGATVDGEKNVQSGTCGDFICQSQADPTDVWVVKRRIFVNTYSVGMILVRGIQKWNCENLWECFPK